VTNVGKVLVKDWVTGATAETVRDPVTNQSGPVGSITTGVGGYVTLQAFINPSNAPAWPQDKPYWELVNAPTNSATQFTNYSGTPLTQFGPLDEPGSYTFNVSSSRHLSVKVNSTTLALKKLWETSNKANQIFNPTRKDDFSTLYPLEIEDPNDDQKKATYAAARNKLYIVAGSHLVATPPHNLLTMQGNSYAVSLDLDIQPVESRGKIICAVFKNGQKVSGSDSVVPADPNTPVRMVFADPEPDKPAVTDFEIKVGFDNTPDGVLDEGEAKTAQRLPVYIHAKDEKPRYAMIRGINKLQYEKHLENTGDLLVAKKWGIPWDPGQPDRLAIHARSFLKIFKEGTFTELRDDMKPTSTETVQLDAFKQATAADSCLSEWLTHNSGAQFNEQGVATIKLYEWDHLTRVAKFFAERTPFALEKSVTTRDGYFEFQTPTGKALKQFYENHVRAAAEDRLRNRPVDSVTIMPSPNEYYKFPDSQKSPELFKSLSPAWVQGVTVEVGAGAHGGAAGAFVGGALTGSDRFDEFDANGAIGRGRVLEPKYQFFVKKIETGWWLWKKTKYVVEKVLFECTIEDLYDFNYEDAEPAPHAAAVQLGYGNGDNGRNNGIIYRYRIKIHYNYFWPFDQTTIPNFSIKP
jgi:hypothetical protein